MELKDKSSEINSRSDRDATYTTLDKEKKGKGKTSLSFYSLFGSYGRLGSKVGNV